MKWGVNMTDGMDAYRIWKPSFCYYKQWTVKKQNGRKPVIPLRFSKSGDPNIEKWYATHWVDSSRIAELKISAGKDEDGQEQ